MQAQLARIASFREPMQRLGELAKVFDELRKFAMQVSDLARVLESMHNFQDRLRPVPNQFAPLEALDEKLKRLCASFAEHLSELADALGPAVTLQDQLASLARAFEPAKVLREEFSGLAQSFALGSPAMSDGRSTASSPSNPATLTISSSSCSTWKTRWQASLAARPTEQIKAPPSPRRKGPQLIVLRTAAPAERWQVGDCGRIDARPC